MMMETVINVVKDALSALTMISVMLVLMQETYYIMSMMMVTLLLNVMIEFVTLTWMLQMKMVIIGSLSHLSSQSSKSLKSLIINHLLHNWMGMVTKFLMMILPTIMIITVLMINLQ